MKNKQQKNCGPSLLETKFLQHSVLLFPASHNGGTKGQVTKYIYASNRSADDGDFRQ